MKEKELEKIFKALGNRRRLLILIFIKKRKKANVGEISEAIKLSFKSTSRHLSILVSAGILEKDQFGLFSIYSLSEEMGDMLKRILSSL
ncbi:MAG: metalloregulator ArsR/SmtB family transcription factor [Patescibacteria group bacterium]|mgnify:CR=1 FL=1